MGLFDDLKILFGDFTKNITDKLDEIKPKDIQAVIVKEDPDTFSRTETEKITTIIQKWSNKDFPQIEIKNDLFSASVVKEISLVPDTLYKTKGKCYVTIDDSVVMILKKTFNIFENLKESKVKPNKTINKDSSVKLFMISSDGSTVGLTMQVTFGD